MKAIMFLIAALLYQGGAYSQQPVTGGSWSFKANHCRANKFLRHRESTTVWDTTQKPNPKFIIDFRTRTPTASGKYTVVQGPPMAADQVSMGVGLLKDGNLTFYSTTGGDGKEQVTVTASDGYIRITGRAIDMANQKDPGDKAPLTFDITIKP